MEMASRCRQEEISDVYYLTNSATGAVEVLEEIVHQETAVSKDTLDGDASQI